MKLKNFLEMATMALVSMPAFAQYEGTDVSDRIGHGEDSLKCRENLTLFGDYFKAKNYEEAYNSWKVVMEKAPLAQIRIYQDGDIICQELLKKETDAAKKQEIFNKIFLQILEILIF